MNNTSRSSTYGIIAILLLLVVGVVWFYSSRTASGTSSKAHVAQKSGMPQQANHTASNPGSSAGGSDIATSQPTFTIANKDSSDWKASLARDLQLNDDEVAEIVGIIDSARSRVRALMADQSTITEVTNKSIRLQTGLTDEQSNAIELEMYEKMFQLLGPDRESLLLGRSRANIRGETDDFGRGKREYLFAGAKEGQNPTDLNPDVTETFEPFVDAYSVFVYWTTDDGYERTRHAGSYPAINYSLGRDRLARYYGKMATMILALIEEQKKQAK